MSVTAAPARSASATPSPVDTTGLVVAAKTWPIPPVASTTARARTAPTPSSAPSPSTCRVTPQARPAPASAQQVEHQRVLDQPDPRVAVDRLVQGPLDLGAGRVAAGVHDPVRRGGRPRGSASASRPGAGRTGCPSGSAPGPGPGPRSTSTSTAAGSHRPTPATSVSAACAGRGVQRVEHGGDPALGPAGRPVVDVDLGDHGDVQPGLAQVQRGGQAGDAGADHDHVGGLGPAGRGRGQRRGRAGRSTVGSPSAQSTRTVLAGRRGRDECCRRTAGPARPGRSGRRPRSLRPDRKGGRARALQRGGHRTVAEPQVAADAPVTDPPAPAAGGRTTTPLRKRRSASSGTPDVAGEHANDSRRRAAAQSASRAGYGRSGARHTPTNSASCRLAQSIGVSVSTPGRGQRVCWQPSRSGDAPFSASRRLPVRITTVAAASTVVTSVRSHRNQREPAVQPGPDGTATASRSRQPATRRPRTRWPGCRSRRRPPATRPNRPPAGWPARRGRRRRARSPPGAAPAQSTGCVRRPGSTTSAKSAAWQTPAAGVKGRGAGSAAQSSIRSPSSPPGPAQPASSDAATARRTGSSSHGASRPPPATDGSRRRAQGNRK